MMERGKNNKRKRQEDNEEGRLPVAPGQILAANVGERLPNPESNREQRRDSETASTSRDNPSRPAVSAEAEAVGDGIVEVVAGPSTSRNGSNNGNRNSQDPVPNPMNQIMLRPPPAVRMPFPFPPPPFVPILFPPPPFAMNMPMLQQPPPFNPDFQRQVANRVPFFTKLLNIIRWEVNIPPQEFTLAMNLTHHLSALFYNASAGLNAAVLFRNWAFHLRYHPNEYKIPLVFMRSRRMEKINNRVFQQLLLNGAPRISLGTAFNLQDWNAIVRFDKALGHNYAVDLRQLQPHNGTQISTHFTLYAHVGLSMEAQLWRLAQYLCCFDTRSQTLMEAAYYWANLNKVEVGVSNVTIFDDIVNLAPDPLPLTWMVVFFLGNRGIIPTPEMVFLRGDHCNTFYTFWETKNDNSCCRTEKVEQVDIGFNENHSYPEEWIKNAKVDERLIAKGADLDESVVDMIIDMFQFWGQFAHRSWVISTGTAKYHETKNFLTLEFKENGPFSKDLRKLQQDISEKGRGRYEEAKRFQVQQSIHFSNPFCPARNILIRKKALGQIEKTGQSLQSSLKELKRSKDGHSLNPFDVQRLFTIEGQKR